MSATIDSSVTTVLFSEDSRQAAARGLLQREESLHAPYLILAETANALWKLHRFGNLSRPIEDTKDFLQSVLPDRLTLCPDDLLVGAAFEIAQIAKHPVYDCFFVALAVLNDEPLFTFDRRLIQKLSGTPWAGVASTP